MFDVVRFIITTYIQIAYTLAPAIMAMCFVWLMVDTIKYRKTPN